MRPRQTWCHVCDFEELISIEMGLFDGHQPVSDPQTPARRNNSKTSCLNACFHRHRKTNDTAPSAETQTDQIERRAESIQTQEPKCAAVATQSQVTECRAVSTETGPDTAVAEKIQHLEDVIQALERKCGDLKAGNDVDRNSLKDEIQALKKEREGLKEERDAAVTNLRFRSFEVQSLEEKNSGREHVVQECKASAQRLERELLTTKLQTEVLSECYTKARMTIDDWRRKLCEAREQQTMMKEQHQTELEQTKQAHSQEVERLQSRIDDLKAAGKKLQGEKDSLEEKVSASEGAYESLSSSHMEQTTKYGKTLDELAAIKSKIGVKVIQLASLERKLQQQEGDYDKLQASYVFLMAESTTKQREMLTSDLQSRGKLYKKMLDQEMEIVALESQNPGLSGAGRGTGSTLVAGATLKVTKKKRTV